MSENELKRLQHHLEKGISVITRIETEHLDYQVQMRRLQDVAARFAPLMHRLDCSLPNIQSELGLPRTSTAQVMPSEPHSYSFMGITNGDGDLVADDALLITDGGGRDDSATRVEELPADEKKSYKDSKNIEPSSDIPEAGYEFAEPKYDSNQNSSMASSKGQHVPCESKDHSAVCTVS